ncbi:hypothetical protein [Oligoflexus sp.]|uniref:hypothetical protein n=1 Tax=Oligoflexus sp. TaxID=1971216 RepID=UPI002D76AD4D|nr:hypothetical protein [Oligoflexus sp.]
MVGTLQRKSDRADESIVQLDHPKTPANLGLAILRVTQLKTEEAKDLANKLLRKLMLDLGTIDNLEHHTASVALFNRQRGLDDGAGSNLSDLVRV